MQTFKAVAIVFSVFFLHSAQAFQCRFFSDRTELEIEDVLVTSVNSLCPDDVSHHLDKPLILFLKSPGGDIDRIRGIVREMREFMKTALERSAYLPTVVVREECSSACIPILSGLNQMAGESAIRLLVDRKTNIGFHGCSDVYEEEPKLRFSIPGTKRYLGYFKELGGSSSWIEANDYLFRSPEVTLFTPESRSVQDSGILNHAELVDLNSYRIALDKIHFSASN